MEEIVVPFPDPLLPLRQVRSTLLVASRQSLTAAKLADRYWAKLPPAHHDTIRDLPAGAWVPVELAEAHYRACDAMGLAPQEIQRMGSAVADATAKVFLQLVLRTAREVGATPWLPLGNSQRYWSRYYDGSSVQLTKVGPKEGRIEVRASSLAAFGYWRGAFGAILAAIATPFCTKAYVTERPAPSRTGALYRIAWA